MKKKLTSLPEFKSILRGMKRLVVGSGRRAGFRMVMARLNFDIALMEFMYCRMQPLKAKYRNLIAPIRKAFAYCIVVTFPIAVIPNTFG